jgi:hypothetical protein
MNAKEAAAVLGKLGGKSTSPAKQQASRANGKLGGRPRNNPAPEPAQTQPGTTLPLLLTAPRKGA